MRRLPTTAYLAFAALLGLAATRPAYAGGPAACPGDCNADGKVEITEVVTVINIALGGSQSCAAGDGDGSGAVEVNDVILAVNVADNAGGLCPTPVVSMCGNAVVDAGEDCDVGGICTGGAMSGTVCDAEEDCGTGQPGVCVGGTGALRQCNGDGDCGGGKCTRCRTFGGSAIAGDTAHTCAANCTFETKIALTLKQGEFSPGGAILQTGSGAVVHSGILGDVPLPLGGGGASLSITVGEPDATTGVTPMVLRAEDLDLPAIPVASLACACVRGIPARTCGGFVLDLAGDLATDCTPGFTAGDSVCTDAGKPTCAFVHGPGNSGSGLIGCSGGLTPINLAVSQDSRGSNDPPACLTPGTGAPTCADAPMITLDGTSSTNGAAILVTHTAIGVKTGSCTGFCTDSDPQAQRGTVNPLVLTTGEASGVVFNVDGQDDVHNQNPTTMMPWAVTGSPTSCENLLGGNVSGTTFAGTFTAINQNMLGDIVVEAVFQAE